MDYQAVLLMSYLKNVFPCGIINSFGKFLAGKIKKFYVFLTSPTALFIA
jgi:hypothetical protein